VSRSGFKPWSLTLKALHPRDLLSLAEGTILHPHSETWNPVGLASEGAQLIDAGLSTKVGAIQLSGIQLTAQLVQCLSS